jgi:hypothetical protein
MKNEVKIQVATAIAMEKRKLFHLAEGISSVEMQPIFRCPEEVVAIW